MSDGDEVIQSNWSCGWNLGTKLWTLNHRLKLLKWQGKAWDFRHRRSRSWDLQDDDKPGIENHLQSIWEDKFRTCAERRSFCSVIHLIFWWLTDLSYSWSYSGFTSHVAYYMVNACNLSPALHCSDFPCSWISSRSNKSHLICSIGISNVWIVFNKPLLETSGLSLATLRSFTSFMQMALL